MSNNEDFNPSNKPLDSAWVPPIEPQPNYPTQGDSSTTYTDVPNENPYQTNEQSADPYISYDQGNSTYGTTNVENGNPYTTSSYGSTNPYTNSSQGSANPYANSSQGSTNPYMNSSQESSNPYMSSSQGSTNPYMNSSQSNTNPYMNVDASTHPYSNPQGNFADNSSYTNQENTSSSYPHQNYTAPGPYGSGSAYANQNYHSNNYANPTVPEKNTTATISLIVGIAGILLSCCCGLGILAGIIAIILAIVSKGGRPMSGKAIAGLITGIIAIIISVISIIAIMNNDEFKNQYYRNYYNQSQDLFKEEANIDETVVDEEKDTLFDTKNDFQFLAFENEVTDSILKDIANFK